MADRKTEKLRNEETERWMDRKTKNLRDGETERWTGRDAERWKGGKTEMCRCKEKEGYRVKHETKRHTEMQQSHYNVIPRCQRTQYWGRGR